MRYRGTNSYEFSTLTCGSFPWSMIYISPVIKREKKRLKVKTVSHKLCFPVTALSQYFHKIDFRVNVPRRNKWKLFNNQSQFIYSVCLYLNRCFKPPKYFLWKNWRRTKIYSFQWWDTQRSGFLGLYLWINE